MKFTETFLTGFLFSCLCFISKVSLVVSTHRSWILEVQLHNYSNPHGAYYSADGTSPYCCCSTLTCYTSKINKLNCGIVECTGVFILCVEDHCVEYPQELTKNSGTLGQDASGSLSLYPTLVYRSTSDLETVEMHGSMYHQKSDLLPGPLPGNNAYVIDNFTIPMKFEMRSDFHSPTATEGLFNVITVVTSFRFTCNTNYYGEDCSIYCSRRAGDTFICSSNGNKICDQGYTNPDNNCKDKVIETTPSSCVITSIVHSVTHTLSIVATSTVSLSASSYVPATHTVQLSSAAVSTVLLSSSCRPVEKAKQSSTDVLFTSPHSGSGTDASHNNQQARNTSTAVACDCKDKNEAAKFHVVLALLLLTYAGIGLFVFIKLAIYLRLNKRVQPKSSTFRIPKGLRASASRGTNDRTFDNPNYDTNTSSVIVQSTNTTKRNGNDTLSSHWKEKSDSSSIYASLINNETGHQTAMETSADRQYEMIDSQSNSNMYTFISTNSTRQ